MATASTAKAVSAYVPFLDYSDVPQSWYTSQPLKTKSPVWKAENEVTHSTVKPATKTEIKKAQEFLHTISVTAHYNEPLRQDPFASPFKTQKARGIDALRRREVFVNYRLSQKHLCDFVVGIYPHNMEDIELPAFARPCPTVPRHGFVESRTVNNTASALQVVAETLKADPEGEVVFMPRLSGKWSGVITHAGVTFGKENDGATAGKSAVTIPAYSDPDDFKYAVGVRVTELSGIKETSYVEFVEDRDKPAFVQLRDGPETPRTKNYIPATTQVTRVIETDNEDLLEWERVISEASGTEGLVVHHPGGSLTSHYAVHCIIHKIPVILDDDAPQIGDVLEPASWVAEDLYQADFEEIASLISRRFAKGYGDYSQRAVAMTAVGTLHACPTWGADKHLLRLRAEGVVAALVYSATACIGEVRHWYESGPGRNVRYTRSGEIDKRCKNSRPRVEALSADTLFKEGIERSSVYDKALKASAKDLHRWVNQSALDFRADGWERAYGGPAWADVAEAVAEGFRTVEVFTTNPNASTWAAVMDVYNRVVNAAHNNGKVLTKWLSRGAMDRIAEVPGPAFVNPFVAEVVLGWDVLPVVKRERKSLSEFLLAA